jgi:hypothetical protein
VVAPQQGLEGLAVAGLGGGDEGAVGPVVMSCCLGDPAERRTGLSR